MVPVGEVTYPFVSEVIACQADSFEIKVPVRKGIRVPLKPHQLVTLLFPTEHGLFTMDACIQEAADPRSCFAIPGAQELAHIQRRKHRRIPLLEPLQVQLAADPEWGMNLTMGAELKELSAGGCALWIDADLMDGMPVIVELALAERGRLRLPGEIVHSTTAIFPLAEGNRHVSGICFTDLDPIARGWVTQSVLRAAG